MKLDKLVKLEKALEGRLDRLTRRKGAPEEPSEWIPAMLDEIERQVVATGGRGRVFPYERVRVEVRVREASLESARVLFGAGAFEARVRERLRQIRCEAPEALSVRSSVRVRAAGDESPYAMVFRGRVTERAAAPAAPPPTAAVPSVQITVLEGHARRKTYELKLDRIHLGRMESVETRGASRLRRNHVGFTDREDPVNATVSRAHAHLEYATGDGFRVFDDGSAHGTRVVREGRTIPVPRGATRGVRLQDGDEIELGMARVAFRTGSPAG